MRWLVRMCLRFPAFSPVGFLVRAGVLAAVFGILTLCGLRQYMSVLSLTFPEGTARGLSLFFCLCYLISYFSFIVGVPILVIGAGVFAIVEKAVGQPLSQRRS